MRYPVIALLCYMSVVVNVAADEIADQKALLAKCEIPAAKLMPLAIETALVRDAKPAAVICHADDPAWLAAAQTIRRAIDEATGVDLPLMTDKQFTPEQFDGQNAILVGHLDNHRHVARLYHNYFVCLDVGAVGETGFEIRTVHDPFGTGHNYVLVGGSTAAGTRLAAETFAGKVRKEGTRGRLSLGRILEVKNDRRDLERPRPMTAAERDAAIEAGRKVMFSPGQARSAVSQLVRLGIAFHQTGELRQGEAYRGLMLALAEYYEKDKFINSGGMRRYDADFRDAWTYQVMIVWDLTEESGLFSDAERLRFTNLCIRLALECIVYQGWDRPSAIAHWKGKPGIIHNHQSFPALGVLFVGNYLKRHYKVDYVGDWLAVAHGVFSGQKHVSKPQEDAAAYVWLPIIHTAIYALSQGDMTYLADGHLRDAARLAMVVIDNRGYQGAFGDHDGLRSFSAMAPVLRMALWYYRDPGLAWGVKLVGRDPTYTMGQDFNTTIEPLPPSDLVGASVVRTTKASYDLAAKSKLRVGRPNIPLGQTFDKLSLRGGWGENDEYLLLDGHGRGTHMHQDVNAIISYATGGEPLLVDGEYIRSVPKYHNSLVIIRDGQGESAPAVAGLGRADSLHSGVYTRTWVTGYNGSKWTRSIVWRRNAYLLVHDGVEAQKPGDYTLRCCWRPWGQATLDGQRLSVRHAPLELAVVNLDGADCQYDVVKTVGDMPIGRLSQQVQKRLDKGQTYQFANLVRAAAEGSLQGIAGRAVADNLLLVHWADKKELIALWPGKSSLPGLDTDAEMVLLAPDRLMACGFRQLTIGDESIEASSPIALETESNGAGSIDAATAAEVKIKLCPNASVMLDAESMKADAQGRLTLKLAAGRYRIVVPLDYQACWSQTARLLERDLSTAASRQASSQPAARSEAAWQWDGFPPIPEPLKVESVTSSVAPRSTYGPIERLIDRKHGGSTDSVMWPAGASPVVTLTLGSETLVKRVVLREWHFGESNEISTRKLELSSDGFKKDVRVVSTAFTDAGREAFGRNINTLMAVDVGQRAQQLRLTLKPAKKNGAIYMAEAEVHGLIGGRSVPIHALAAGRFGKDRRQCVVACGESGRIVALDAAGKPLWTYATPDAAPVHALACADVDGEGRDEVLFGGRSERLGLLGDDGRLRWEVQPPRYRGTPSDVINVMPADINADGRPEIIAGCRSWQYFAYDASGKMLWQNVIYAHSASVACADDLDGDHRAEIVAGNVYYTLNVISPDGKRRWLGGSIGPEITAVGTWRAASEKGPRVVAGVDGGMLYTYDAAGKSLWQTHLGDRITRIVPCDVDGDNQPELICAAESAHVFALKPDGQILWRSALPDGATDMVLLPGTGSPRFAVAAGSAGVCLLDVSGKIVKTLATAGRARLLVVSDGRLAVSTDQGKIASFDVE